MTENELDEMLNRWRAPKPSAGFRAQVLARVPQREKRRFGWPMRWAAAAAVVLCVLSVGTAQDGHPSFGALARAMSHVHDDLFVLVDQLWLDYQVAHFRGSNPKIYVDGELVSGAEFGGQATGLWLRVPGEGKYYMTLNRRAIEGPAPPPAGRFDGHVLEFESGGRTVRIESAASGGGRRRPVYVVGLRADR
jgi:hypothetical protein